MISVFRALAFAIPVLSIFAFPTAGCADVYGLVVGINDYRYLKNLHGAVDDAKDIGTALKQAGARQVEFLLDGQASYRRIKNTWNTLLRRARPGDTLVFSYAGHGGQEPELVKGSEADGKDEVFQLSGFNTLTKSGLRERIVDNEISNWFRNARDKKVRVVFVADSCHSGTMNRAMDDRADPSVRAIPPYGLPDDVPISTDSNEGARIGEKDLPNVTFLAATRDDKLVPEITIDGRKRGALSWAFARALERGADRDHNGILTRYELESYILPRVRMVSEARQIPDIHPRAADADQDLLPLVIKADATSIEAGIVPLRLKVLNSLDFVSRLRSLQGASIVSSGDADLIWDVRDGSVINGNGDVVAENVEAISLQGIVDKWRSLPVLKELVARQLIDVYLWPGNGRHPEGSSLSLATDPLSFSHLAVIGLQPDGGLNFLYPLEKEKVQWEKGSPFRLDLQVNPPFGADHLLIIASDRELTDLRDQLRTANANELPVILRRVLKGARYALGLEGFYTYAGEGTK